jgi:hypothetical protein
MTEKPWLLLLACLWACGQDDPGSEEGSGGSSSGGTRTDGGDVSGAAAEPIGSPDSLYPLVSGSTWTYLHGGGASEWNEVATLDAVDYLGEPAFLLASMGNPNGARSESILVANETSVARVHREEYMGDAIVLSADYDPGFLRFDGAWPAAANDTTFLESYQRMEYDAMGTQTRSGSRSHRYTVQAVSDTVDVPAGSFEGCLRMQRSRIRTAGAAVMEGDEDLFWYCPGIGKVREEDQTTGQTEELVSCEIPGGACP